MGRHNDRRVDLLSCFNRLRDDRLEERPGEMEASQQRVNVLNACLHTRLPKDVNHARMSTASRHHQPLIAHELRNEVTEELTAGGGSEMQRSPCCFVSLL
jgi:hypothetical protein